VFLPDLTVTEIVAEGDLHCLTVKNIGQATSPTTALQLSFRRRSDQRLFAKKRIRVLPIRVHQSIRFRLHGLPQGPVQVIAEVDPDHRVAETDEQNNDLTLTIAGRPPALEPVPPEEIVVDINVDINVDDSVASEVNDGRSVRGTDLPDHQE